MNVNMSPWELCQLDLKNLINRLQGEGIVSVVAGDTNTTWDVGSQLHDSEPRRLRHIDSRHRWANQCGTGNVMQLREHGPILTFTDKTHRTTWTPF